MFILSFSHCVFLQINESAWHFSGFSFGTAAIALSNSIYLVIMAIDVQVHHQLTAAYYLHMGVSMAMLGPP
jgi:hypothetical protein